MAAGDPRRRPDSGALTIEQMIPDRIDVAHTEMEYELLRCGIARAYGRSQTSGQIIRVTFGVLA